PCLSPEGPLRSPSTRSGRTMGEHCTGKGGQMSDGSKRTALLDALGLQESATDEALDTAAKILEGVSDGFFFLDRDGRYRYVNARGGALLGREPKSLLGKHIWT